jgi:hypothetical protein
MIYFIEAVGLDHVKIGHTDKPLDRRLATLQIGNSFPLRVLGTVQELFMQKERDYHRQFRSSRIRGEWFRWTAELVRVIARDTKQYDFILLMDHLLGKPLTRDSLWNIPPNTDLFMWRAMYDEVCSRLLAGESQETIVGASRLAFDPASDYYGWYKGPASRHYGSTYHLLFVKQEKLYRLSGKFIGPLHEPGFGYTLPKEFSKSFPAGPAGVHIVCRLIWERMSPEWQKDDSRFYF